jgi:hypothetical protein
MMIHDWILIWTVLLNQVLVVLLAWIIVKRDMVMGKLFQDSGSTPEARREEADRIIDILFHEISPESMEGKEADFIEQMEADGRVSPKQLFWLRDIKSKYAE